MEVNWWLMRLEGQIYQTELSEWMTDTTTDRNKEALKETLGDVPERWKAKILQFYLRVKKVSGQFVQ